MHVLLAEPHLPLAKPLIRGLAEEGIAADLARDGDEADALARSGTYDALLVNWRLPRHGGAEMVCGACNHLGLGYHPFTLARPRRYRAYALCPRCGWWEEM
jgi:DNA-binding response OmpR family regulator